MKTRAILLGPLLALSLSANAQQSTSSDFQVPKAVSLKNAADYARYEKEALAAANWLLQTPLGQQDAKRKEVSTFFFQWAAGTPDVKIEIKEYLQPIASASPALVPVFVAAYVQHVLTTHDTNALSSNLAAVKSMLAYYKGPNGVDRSDAVEELLQKEKDGTLESYLKSSF